MYNSNLDYIICGDLNAKSAASKNGEILDNIIASNNCQIINNNQHTFHRIYNDYTQILDLIICSPAPTCKLTSFEVLTKQELNSDHYPICAIFDLLPKKQRRIINNDLRFDFKRADWTKFNNELSQMNIETETASKFFDSTSIILRQSL